MENIKAFLEDLVVSVQPENETTDFCSKQSHMFSNKQTDARATLVKLQYRLLGQQEKRVYGHSYSSWTVPIGHTKKTHEFLYARMSPFIVRTKLTMQG